MAAGIVILIQNQDSLGDSSSVVILALAVVSFTVLGMYFLYRR